MTIESARYGCDGNMRDVREAVLKHIVNGRIEVVVSNTTLGIDPCGGTPKELVVSYRLGDGPLTEVRRKKAQHTARSVTLAADGVRCDA